MLWLVLALSGLLVAAQAVAACSRPIVVPVAPTGLSVIIEGQRIGGIYPEWLRRVGEANGCQFEFVNVPRARLTQMFLQGQEADLLLPASRTVERDKVGDFLPLMRLTLNLISRADATNLPSDLEGLRRQKEARMAAVRSYSWGDEYEAFSTELHNAGRVDAVADLAGVMAMLNAGRSAFTILPPTLIYPFLLQNGGRERYRVEPLAGLPLATSGVYLSKSRLSEADRQVLRRVLTRAAQDGSLVQSFRAQFPEEVLARDLRPIGSTSQ